jgi:hypothetical protein
MENGAGRDVDIFPSPNNQERQLETLNDILKRGYDR